MSLVSLERGVVAELDINAALPQLRHAVCEIVDHRDCRRLLLHLQERLVLALQHQHIGHPTKGNSQVDDLCFSHIVGYIPDKINMSANQINMPCCSSFEIVLNSPTHISPDVNNFAGLDL